MNDYSDDRELPWSCDAEQNVVGALMAAPDRLMDIVDWLQPSDFFRGDHQLIYRAIIELIDKSHPVDSVTLGEWFEGQGKSELVAGGVYYLVELQNNVASAANVVAYAEIVAEKARLRQLVDMGQKLIKVALKPRGASSIDIASRLSAAAGQLAPIRGAGAQTYKQVMKRLHVAMEERFNGGRARGLPTPWGEVNKAIGGLQDGEVIVLGARSNMGKSALGFQISRFTAMRNNRVMQFSMEMNVEDVAARDVAAVGEVPHQWLVGDMTGEDSEIYWSKTTNAMQALSQLDGLIDEEPQLSAIQIVARATREHRRAPLRLVVVDHLHEMSLPGKQGEVIERAQALRELKGLAKRLKCPVLVLAQLNRDAADASRPQIKNLRGSGGIEEVADLVLFLHRPDAYNPQDRPGLVEVIVAKGRNVKTGTVIPLQNRFDIMRADDWEGPVPEPMVADVRPPSGTRPIRSLGKPIGRGSQHRSGRSAAAGDDSEGVQF